MNVIPYDNNVLKLNKALKTVNAKYSLLVQWMKLRNSHISLETYFKGHKYSTIAIYGLSELGKLLVDELIDCPNIFLKYAVDRNYKNIDSIIPIYPPESDLEQVDVMVITALNDYISILDNMKYKVKNIISIEDIIYELY